MDGSDSANSVMLTSDQGYILAGSTCFETNLGFPGFAWMIKTDSKGNEIWNKTLTKIEFSKELVLGDGPGWLYGHRESDGAHFKFKINSGSISSTLPTTDGGYILAGDRLRKVDSEGNEIWNKNLGGWATPTEDGGYILAGDRLRKVDSEGNEIWNKTSFGEISFGVDEKGVLNRIDLVQPTQDGGYVLKGTRAYYNSEITWMIKVDSQGKEVWNRTFSRLGSAPYSILPTANGGFIVAGTIDGNAWLMKTDVDGMVGS